MAVWDLSKTASSNDTIEGITWAEGMNASGVNNGVRAIAAMLKEWQEDIGAALTTGGTADAQTLTTNGGLGALADGVMLGFVAGATNTMPATLNVDALGAKAIRKRGDTALEANDILAGGHYLVTYDASANAGAGAWMLINPSAYLLASAIATQAEQEAATSTTVAVTPGRQKYHPSAAKGWIFFDGTATTPTAAASYNVSSITDNAAGDYTINWSTAFSGTSYSLAGVTGRISGATALIELPASPTASAAQINVRKNSDNTLGDASQISLMAFGDQ